MGKLSNIFGVLALLLAGAAAFFSFTISQRRAEFRLRADKMATTMVEIVKVVDVDSGTALASTISFTPGDPAAGTKGEGSLSADEFHNAKDDSGDFPDFQALLDQGLGHVKAVSEQRNALAEVLATTATTLGLPAEQVDVANLRNLADAEVAGAAVEKVQGHVAAVQTRDVAMIEAITAAAKEIGEPIDETALTARQESRNAEDQIELGDYACATPLGAFKGNVKSLNDRAEEYVATLAGAIGSIKPHDGIFEWEVTDTAIKDKNNYSTSLTQMVNKFGELNTQLDNLVDTKKELAEQKIAYEKLETDLSEAQVASKKAKAELTNLDKLYRQALRDLGKTPDGGSTETPLIPDIEGMVLRVDNEYNYVILNLGAADVREGTEMLVAREDEFIAKIQVAKVLGNISVADILPLAMHGKVKIDDRVIMPTSGRQQQ